MALVVFDIKGVPAPRREHIEAAVESGGKLVAEAYEAWIAADPFRGGFKVLITGPHGFERTATFAIDDDAAVIALRVRETLEG
jgi:hypothetical protein